MSATLIVPDVHGNLDMAAGLLRQAGALNDEWERIPGIRTVQLGDLCNCVGESVIDDMRCLDYAREWFDVLLVGNHEHPYWGGPRFWGFHRDLIIDGRLRSSLSDLYRPAVVVDGILVTHAGFGPEWELVHDSADDVAAWLNDLWRHDPGAPVFSRIGAIRGGQTRTGGILWADWDEPKTDQFSQIVGHSVGSDVRRVDHANGNFTICLDLGGGKHGDKIAGALIDDGVVEIVTYDHAEAQAA